MHTVAEIADRLMMPEREVRAWADRLALAPVRDEAGVARYPDADVAVFTLVRDILACPYVTPALAIHAAEAALRPDYPDDVFPREMEQLRVEVMRLVDASRDLRAGGRGFDGQSGDGEPGGFARFVSLFTGLFRNTRSA